MPGKQLWPITDLDVLVYGVAFNRRTSFEKFKLKKILSKRKDKLFKIKKCVCYLDKTCDVCYKNIRCV